MAKKLKELRYTKKDLALYSSLLIDVYRQKEEDKIVDKLFGRRKTVSLKNILTFNGLTFYQKKHIAYLLVRGLFRRVDREMEEEFVARILKLL